MYRNITTQINNADDHFRQLSLDTRNNPLDDYEYVQCETDLIEDISRVIKGMSSLEFFTRTTEKNSIKQTVFIGKDGYIKIMGMNGNCKKSDTIFSYHRVKYILAHKGLSKLSKQRILSDRKRIKTIEIDHKDGNNQNNLLSNLQALPRKINGNQHYIKMQKMKTDLTRENYAIKNDCEFLLTFF